MATINPADMVEGERYDLPHGQSGEFVRWEISRGMVHAVFVDFDPVPEGLDWDGSTEVVVGLSGLETFGVSTQTWSVERQQARDEAKRRRGQAAFDAKYPLHTPASNLAEVNAQGVNETLLAEWLSNPDPAVREVARAEVRRRGLYEITEPDGSKRIGPSY